MAKPIIIEQIEKIKEINIVQSQLPATGSSTKPVYVSAAGTVSACANELNKTVPSDAVFTDTVTTVASTTGSGNAITEITASNGALTIKKEKTFIESNVGVTHTASTAAGSDTTPIYVNADGEATPITYTIAKSVPSDAVFTDHVPNNATLTIQTAGTDKGTFTADASADKTINITASDLGLSSAMRFIGESTTDPSVSGATISGHTTWAAGEVVIYGTSHYEYVNKDGNNTSASWILLGMAGSYVLNSVTITGTNGLTGGGALSENRTISHAAAASGDASKSLGLYKFGTDAYGHVTGVTAVVASDIPDLSSSYATAAQGALASNAIPKPTDSASNDGKVLTYSDSSKAWIAAAALTSVTVDLTTSWTGTAAPYTQTVSVTGMTTTSVGTFGLATTATAAQYAAAAAAQLLVTAQAAGSITVSAFGTKPTVAIPCVVNFTA